MPATTPDSRAKELSSAVHAERSRLTPASSVAIGISVVVGGVAAVMLDAVPTTIPVIDALYRSLLVAITVLMASRSRRWSLTTGAVLVVIGSASWFLAVSLAALTIAAWLDLLDRRNRVAGSICGAAIGIASLSLSWPTFKGGTALLAAAALVPIWVSGYRNCRRNVRRRIRLGLAAMAVLTLVGVALTGWIAATQAPALESAARRATDAADLLGDGATQIATEELSRAADDFDGVARTTGAWWSTPARLVPGLGANVEVTRRASVAGGELVRSAATISAGVDYDALRLDSGAIDLELMRESREPVRSAVEALDRAESALQATASPWLVPPLADRLDDLTSRVTRAAGDVETALLTVDELPILLGRDRPKRYLMLLGNPAEARDLGGHIGNWAELVADNGDVQVVEVGQPYELFSPGSPAPPIDNAAAGFPAALLELSPEVFPQNWSGSPDLGTVAQLAAKLFPSARDERALDGVIYADPTAFAELLEIAGPVPVRGTDVVLTKDNAVQFFTREQYLLPEPFAGEAVSEAIRETLDRVTSRRLPGPRTLADSFAPIVRAGGFKFISLADPEVELPDHLGLQRPVERRNGGDLLAVTTRNANPSKIDAYLNRLIDTSIDWDPDSGATTSTVTVGLVNSAPTTGVPDVVILPPPGGQPGTNRTQLSVLTPFELDSAQVDGAEVPATSQVETPDLQRHSVTIDVPAGQARSVTFRLSGSVRPGATYDLQWFGQPLLQADRAALRLTANGRPLSIRSGTGTADLPARGDAEFSFEADR